MPKYLVKEETSVIQVYEAIVEAESEDEAIKKSVETDVDFKKVDEWHSGTTTEMFAKLLEDKD